MATTRLFARYTGGGTPSGTERYGDLLVGVDASNPYNSNYSGVKWWSGADEDLGYIIATTVATEDQPTPNDGNTGSVGFFRTDNFDDNEFIDLVKVVSGYQATSAIDAKTWLESNGYWTSWYGPVLSLDAGNTASYPGTGTVWTDLIDGKQFNLINGPGYDPSNGGKFYFFAPGGQYAQCNTSLPNLSTWSIGVWHYYDGSGSGSNPCILTEIYPGNSGQINYSLGNNNGEFSSGFFNGGWQVTDGWLDNNFIGDSLTPNNWYYIVGTYDGTTVKLYVNNTLVDSTSYTGTPISSQGGIRLMMRWDLPDFWGGYLATVDIYDKSLNSLEITNIWNTTKSRFGL